MLPKCGLLDQTKVITIKLTRIFVPEPLPVQSFRYALRLADSIQIQVNLFLWKEPVIFFNIMQFAQVDMSKKLQLDLIVSLKNPITPFQLETFDAANQKLLQLRLPVRKYIFR
jgi:hypothetical protein